MNNFPIRHLPLLKFVATKLVLLSTVIVLLSLFSIAQGQSDTTNPPARTRTEDKRLMKSQNESVMASMFSGTGLVVMLGVMCFALVAVRIVRSRTSEEDHEGVSSNGAPEQESASSEKTQTRKSSMSTKKARAAIFGAYRIKQEVAKLVLGHSYRMEILSSRSPEDMVAIETALLSFITSSESTDNERRQARLALEKHGFVARHCAALLQASDPYERTCAARALGQIGSLTAVPFLLDGLYDTETLVRNQAIASLGELNDTAALDELREVAKISSDLPAHLVNRALNGPVQDKTPVFNPRIVFEITQLRPVLSVEDLPENTTDEKWLEAAPKLSSDNVDERVEAAKVMGEFPMQTSVTSLIGLVRNDLEPSVRSTAVASLAFIDHESVFPAMLLALADESREVRAAAARSVSRLSFDRSGAYTLLLDSHESGELKEFATACLNAGIVSQNIDRLARCDRRQAYEAFSLISLMAKAQMTETLTDAIVNHSDLNVRLSVIHLLAATGQPNVLTQLQNLTSQDKLPEDIKTALFEAIYKLEQSGSKPDVVDQQ